MKNWMPNMIMIYKEAIQTKNQIFIQKISKIQLLKALTNRNRITFKINLERLLNKSIWIILVKMSQKKQLEPVNQFKIIITSKRIRSSIKVWLWRMACIKEAQNKATITTCSQLGHQKKSRDNLVLEIQNLQI